MNRLAIHELILFGVLLLITGFRLLTGQMGFNLGIVYWWLGAMIGFIFVYLDRLIDILVNRPEEIKKIKFDLSFVASLLEEKNMPEKSIMRSVLFLLVWLVMGIFAFFSVGGEFGRGFMMGLGIHLTTDLLRDFLGKGRDVSFWFWQIKRKIEPQEITAVVWGFVILAVLLMLGL